MSKKRAERQYNEMKKRKVWIGIAIAVIGATSVLFFIEPGTAGVNVLTERDHLLLDAAAAHEREWFEQHNVGQQKLQ